MSQVNLLPWCRKLLDQRWHIYCLTAAMYTLCLLTLLLIVYSRQSRQYDRYLAQQQQIEAEHSQQLAELNQRQYLQKKLDQHRVWVKKINRLRVKNHRLVRFFSQVEQVLPALVWLNEVSLHQRQLRLTGKGMDYQQIVTFSQRLSELEFLQQAVLSRVNRNASVAEQTATFSFLYHADWLESQP